MTAGLDRRSLEVAALVRCFVPGFNVVRKSESWPHRVVGWFARLFGAGAYSTNFLTTVWQTAAIPSEVRPLLWQDLLHEGRHAVDHRGIAGVARWLGYGLPQLLVWPLVSAAVATTCLTGSMWWLLGLPTALLSAVAPAPWRFYQELRAYKVTVAVEYWRTRQVSERTLDSIADWLSGPAYAFCWPFRSDVRRRLVEWVEELRTNRAVLDPYLLCCRGMAMRFGDEDA